MKKTFFERLIQTTVKLFVSREFAFLYCLAGASAQVIHTYFLTTGISSLENNYKIVQAVILSAFISTSLLYFTAISDDKPGYKNQKVRDAVTLFMIIEIAINLYYYGRHLIIESIINYSGTETSWYNKIGLSNWFDFGFSVIISILIPYTLKLYSNHIRAKEWIEEIKKNKNIDNNIISDETKLENLKQSIILDIKNELNTNKDESLNDLINEKLKNNNALIEEKVSITLNDIFEKKSPLLVNQFENKLKTIIKNNTDKIKNNE